MKKIILIILLALIYENSFSQKIGQWTTHFSYEKDMDAIVQGDNGLVYALTGGKLFSYDPSDESLEIYNRPIGGDSIANIIYSKKNECLFIIRADADIDILYSNGNYINIPDLKNSTQNIDKRVNDLFIKDDLIYIATNFGLMIVDIAKREIKETVIFRYPFYSAVLMDDVLYVATSQGSLYINIKENIQYPDNWKPVSLSSKYSGSTYTFTDKEIRSMTVFDGKLTFLVPSKALYYLNGDKVEQLLGGYAPTKLHTSNDRMIVYNLSRFWNFTKLNEYNSVTVSGNDLKCIIPHEDKSNEYWTSFTDKKLCEIIAGPTNDNKIEYNLSDLRPDGPLSNYPFFLTYEHNKLLFTGGAAEGNGYNYPGRLSEYEKDEWYNHSKKEIDAATESDCLDFISVVSDPSNPNHLFVATWGKTGLYEITDRKEYKLYTRYNSILEGLNNDKTRLRINGMVYDSKGNMWLLNSMVKNTVKVLQKDGTWSQIYYPQIDDNGRLATNARYILIDKYNNKWAYTMGGTLPYLFIFNENGTIENTADDKTKYVTSFYDQDSKLLPFTYFFKLTEDLTGNIWVGTDAGIFVVYNSTQLLNDPNRSVIFNKVKIPRNDGTNNADILLENVKVIDIKVDGGNRKWLATPLGVYVVSPNGQETIHHFTTENSPLPSNNIMSLAIDPAGTVYIGSDKGLVSYRGEASEGSKSFSDVYAFPNPVKPEYDGPITITGLMANSTVKITDVRGNLINQGTSLGGQYIWNGRNTKKERVETGIYIVFGSSEDGKEGVVTKIMVIN